MRLATSEGVAGLDGEGGGWPGLWRVPQAAALVRQGRLADAVRLPRPALPSPPPPLVLSGHAASLTPY